MNIESIPIDALIPYARNSRTHSDEQVAQVAASIKEFGFTNPVLIDEQGGIRVGIEENLIIGGYFTLISLARSYLVRRWFNRRTS